MVFWVTGKDKVTVVIFLKFVKFTLSYQAGLILFPNYQASHASISSQLRPVDCRWKVKTTFDNYVCSLFPEATAVDFFSEMTNFGKNDFTTQWLQFIFQQFLVHIFVDFFTLRTFVQLKTSNNSMWDM